MKTTRVAGMFAITILLIGALSGCSPTGWSTRQLQDGSRFEQGSLITVRDRSGEEYTGTFLGSEQTPSNVYAERYQVLTEGSILPRIGEHVTLTMSTYPEKTWDGNFEGFDEKHLWVTMDGKTERLYVSGLTSLADSRGRLLQRMRIREMFVDGNIPLMTSLVLRDAGGIRRIPLNEVLAVSGAEGEGYALSGSELRSLAFR